MARVGRVPEGKSYSAKVILGYFTSWKTVLFTLIFSKISLFLPLLMVSISNPSQRCNLSEVSQLLLLFSGSRHITNQAKNLFTALLK